MTLLCTIVHPGLCNVVSKAHILVMIHPVTLQSVMINPVHAHACRIDATSMTLVAPLISPISKNNLQAVWNDNLCIQNRTLEIVHENNNNKTNLLAWEYTITYARNLKSLASQKQLSENMLTQETLRMEVVR